MAVRVITPLFATAETVEFAFALIALARLLAVAVAEPAIATLPSPEPKVYVSSPIETVSPAVRLLFSNVIVPVAVVGGKPYIFTFCTRVCVADLRSTPKSNPIASRNTPLETSGFIWLAISAIVPLRVLRSLVRSSIMRPCGVPSSIDKLLPKIAFHSFFTSSEMVLVSATITPVSFMKSYKSLI